MKSRFRRLTDLFVDGRALLMPDGTYLWVQVLNSFQREEALSDAQVARARLVMALKDKGEEAMKVRARFLEKGREQLEKDLVESNVAGKFADFMEEMRDEEEWKERMEIVLRTEPDQTSKALEESEQALLEKLNGEVFDELSKREKDEKEFLARKFATMSEDELIAAWEENWIDKRGGELATGEYRLTEMVYATRYCEAKPSTADALDHTACEGHPNPFFESKADARGCPTALAVLIQGAIADLNMGGRDPKDLASAASSSDSSPTPSAAED